MVVSLMLPVVLTLCTGVFADRTTSGLMPALTAERHGLERVWFTPVRINPARGEIAHLQLHVSLATSQTVFRVVDRLGREELISERHLDTFGRPRGVDGAQQAAAERVRLLQLQGIEATVEQQVIPDITLYVTGSRGTVHALDAETGAIRWITNVGRSDFPTTPTAFNDHFVAVVNGQWLYVLKAEDGALVGQRRIVGGTPAAGPAIMGATVFVPTLSGRLLAYAFGPDDNSWAERFYARGTVRFPPTVIDDRVLWATDHGVVSSVIAGRQSVHFRVRFSDAIAGPLVYSPPGNVLVVTESGYLYGFDIKTGAIVWRFSTGDEMAQPASVVGDTAYLMSRHAGMHAVSTTDGSTKWWAPTARRFIAATQQRVYTTTTTGLILVLDGATGNLVSRIPVDPTDQVFNNNQTDRIYVGTNSGLIQCFRERGAWWPTVHVTGAEMAQADAAAAAPADGAGPADAAAPRDPFAPEPKAPADEAEPKMNEAEPDVDEADAAPEPAAEEDRDPFGS
jgi:outer membrane protein assembly factor BamB